MFPSKCSSRACVFAGGANFAQCCFCAVKYLVRRFLRRTLRQIFLAYPNSGLAMPCAANFVLKQTPGTMSGTSLRLFGSVGVDAQIQQCEKCQKTAWMGQTATNPHARHAGSWNGPLLFTLAVLRREVVARVVHCVRLPSKSTNGFSERMMGHEHLSKGDISNKRFQNSVDFLSGTSPRRQGRETPVRHGSCVQQFERFNFSVQTGPPANRFETVCVNRSSFNRQVRFCFHFLGNRSDGSGASSARLVP